MKDARGEGLKSACVFEKKTGETKSEEARKAAYHGDIVYTTVHMSCADHLYERFKNKDLGLVQRFDPSRAQVA